jgi:hypothetical protein
MKVALLRVGIDSGCGGTQGPLFRDGTFEFIPIPDDRMLDCRTYGNTLGRSDREFSEMLKKTRNAYHNRAIATQEVIEELIKLAKEMSAANQRGVDLGLNDDEVAFYDALAANDSAVEAMGNSESIRPPRRTG